MSVGDRKVSVLGATIAVTMAFTGGHALAHASRHHGSTASPHRHTIASKSSHHQTDSLAVGNRRHATQVGFNTHHRNLAYRVSYRHTRMASGLGYGAHVIQCVAFAKQDAGIAIAGNARDWWSNAAGIYERGLRPESGSVLSFRANGRMPLGHVAVVSGIEDSRTIVIEQAHWNSRGITRDVEVKDVSQNNDWTAVRVQLNRGGAFGSIYPTHGFIYPRPDHGTLVANDTRAPMPALDRAPADLRVSTRHATPAVLEVAEAPEAAKPLDLTLTSLSFDAPNRALR